MVLARSLVAAEQPQPQPQTSTSSPPPSPAHPLPQIPLHKARQIMTRADFIRAFDHINLFTITSDAFVRADSVPMQRAFRRICAEEGFDAHLEATLKRISDIESLGRTREVVMKDFVGGGRYFVGVREGGGGRGDGGKEKRKMGGGGWLVGDEEQKVWEVGLLEKEEDGDDVNAADGTK